MDGFLTMVMMEMGMRSAEAFHFLQDVGGALKHADWDQARFVVERLTDNYVVLDINHDYVLLEETTKSGLRYVDTFDTKREVMDVINGIKVTIR